MRTDEGRVSTRGRLGRAWVLLSIVLTMMALLAPRPAGATVVTVTIDRTRPGGTSAFAPGAAYGLDHPDPWGDPGAVASARALLRANSTHHSQRMIGEGVLSINPCPGRYDWSTLDARVEFMREMGGPMAINLARAPTWMVTRDRRWARACEHDWSDPNLNAAPLPEHEDAFADLAARVAARYPDVRDFPVWYELQGMYGSKENNWRWDAARYTRLYNKVWDRVKAVRPDARLGGPYVIMQSDEPGTLAHGSGIVGPWGELDQRALDVLDYWLANKRGADFVVVDGGSYDYIAPGVNEFGATRKFADMNALIRARTDLPIWWAEYYVVPGWRDTRVPEDKQNALLATALVHMVRSGAAVAHRWQPEGARAMQVGHKGAYENLWTSTKRPGGGQPYPFHFTQRAIKEHFGPGTVLYPALSSSPDVEALASATATLLVSQRPTGAEVEVDGQVVALAPYEVRLVEAPARAAASSSWSYLSDRAPLAAASGWGPPERDRSNGEREPGDGPVLSLNRRGYSKGLGVHAPSDVRYGLDGRCSRFAADVGIDDYAGGRGSVVFEVWADGAKLWESGTMTGEMASQPVSVDVSGRRELRLVVADAGDGTWGDHADWADARVSCL